MKRSQLTQRLEDATNNLAIGATKELFNKWVKASKDRHNHDIKLQKYYSSSTLTWATPEELNINI